MESSPRLIWSGPGRDARDETRRVFEELFTSAERSIWISSYVVGNKRYTLGRLAEHIDANPELEVNLVLHVPSRKDEDRTARKVAREFARRFWKRWPGSRRPVVWYDPRHARKRRGQLHAKLVVVDNERLFVTSANLTRAAWDRNIEVGVLLQDPALAIEAVAHLKNLVRRKHLVRLTGSPSV